MPWVLALAAYSNGILLLAEGDTQGALVSLRESWGHWSGLEAPYEAARCQVQLGIALRELGDEESARMEFATARAAFSELGARPALAAVERLETLVAGTPQANTGPLSPREAEVLRLVSEGMSNRDIAARLYLSEKTVARHVSNILVKLGLPSRSAATAYAYAHGLAGHTSGTR
jgi:DNA-binding NarL/FixJ family response regulator